MTSPIRFWPRRLLAATLIVGLVAPPVAAQSPTDVWTPRRTVPSYPARTVTGTTAPVFMPGGGGVTDGGAATYDIPLWVPAGPQGMQPQMSIAYGGGSSNGHLGVGFGLTGLSAITPCAKTFASEGYADGVDFNIPELLVEEDRDSYCLDGHKLVLRANPVRGREGRSLYRTEIETFQHITGYHAVAISPTEEVAALAAPPVRFDVRARDGSTRTYEAIMAPQLLATGKATNGIPDRPEVRGQVPIAYPIKRAVDRHGNRIEYDYEYNDAFNTQETAWRIKTISYSFVDGKTPRRQLRFSYGTRSDHQFHYVRGVRITTRSLLSQIDAVAPNPVTSEVVWSYRLTYRISPDTKRSLLSTVKVCDQSGVCSWTRSFGWSETNGAGASALPPGPVEFDATSMGYDTERLLDYHEGEANWLTPNDTRVILYDIDGDGDEDALYRTQPSGIDFDAEEFVTADEHGYRPYAGAIKVRLSSQTNPLNEFAYDVTEQLEPGLRIAAQFPLPANRFAFANLGKSRIGDFDGDGQKDLMLARTFIDETKTKADLYGKYMYGFTTFWGDHGSFADGNPGLDDLEVEGFAVQIGFGVPPYTEGESPPLFRYQMPSYQRVVADLDGDGKVDVLDPIKGRVCVDGPDLTDPDPAEASCVSATALDLHEPVADGFLYASELTSNAGVLEPFDHHWTCGNDRAVVADVDGDGRQDALAATGPYTGGSAHDALTGSGTYKRLTVSDTWKDDRATRRGAAAGTSRLWGGDCRGGPIPDLVMGDWNGDGLPDALYPPGSYFTKNSAGYVVPNEQALVRWNLGNGFAPAQVHSVDGPLELVKAMEQKVPDGKQGETVAWDRGTRVADVDGDGRSDIIAFRQDTAACTQLALAVPGVVPDCTTRVILYRSRGSYFQAEELWSWQDSRATLTHGFTTAQVGDITGDGSPDLVHVAGGRLHMLELPWRTMPDQLKVVKDGSSVHPLETFEYNRAWWGDAPRPEATVAKPANPASCAWPIACVRNGFPVVRVHQVFTGSRSDGTAMMRTQIHTYENPRRSLIGRGSLGFGAHEIWERERGSYTRRVFDNERMVDPVPASQGGIFHPEVGLPYSIVQITPRTRAPSATQLAGPSLAPGIAVGTPTAVRTHVTTAQRELRPDASGRVIEILPTHTVVTEVDDTANHATARRPHYTGTEPNGVGSTTTTTRHYDEHGNVDSMVTEISEPGSSAPLVTSKMTATFDERISEEPVQWHLGLPTYVATQTFDADDTLRPTRVMRSTFDARGNLTSTSQRAMGPTYDMCLLTGATALACEAETTTIEITQRDSFGNPQIVTARAPGLPSRTTETAWDSEGVYPTMTTDPLGFQHTTLIHPALGVPVLTVDVIGTPAHAIYDGFARLRTASRPGTPDLTRTYAEVSVNGRRGLQVTDTRVDGTQSYQRTDELGRTIETGTRGFDLVWTYTKHEYDLFGNRIQSSVPEASLASPVWARSEYDRLGQQLTQTTPSPDSATTRFTPGLRSSLAEDAEGHITYVNRDAAGRTIESGHLDDLEAPLGEVKFSYGAFDQVDRVVDARGNASSMAYDPFGRMAASTEPDVGRTRWRHDGFGQPSFEERANGDTFDRTFDLLGRLTREVGPDGISRRFYDEGSYGDGKLTRVESTDDVDTAITYDSLGRTKTVAQTVQGATDVLTHRYDSYGRLRYLFYPESAGHDRFVTSYTYGSDGFLHEIRDASGCGIDPNGTSYSTCIGTPLWEVIKRNARHQLTEARFGNNLQMTVGHFKETGRVQRLTAPGITLDYEYYADGLVEHRSEANGRDERFEYDEMHRLDFWRLQGPARKLGDPIVKETDYHYDELGNLDRVVTNQATTFTGTFGANGKPHALTWSSIGGTYTYDEIGLQRTGDGRVIEYNRFNLPISITSGTSTQTFAYDDDGRRALHSDASGTTRYLGRLFEHRTQRGGPTDSFFVYGDGGLVAQVDYSLASETTRYVVNDPLGSAVSTLTHAPAAVQERTYFDPFGGRITAEGASSTDAFPSTSRGFTGHEEDGNGLINMQGRMYDRRQYRFLTPDPVITDPLFGQAYNPYSYVLNNPLNLVDPSGFSSVSTNPASGGEGTNGGTSGAGGAHQPAPPPPAEPKNDPPAGDERPGGGTDAAQSSSKAGTPPPKAPPIANVQKREATRLPTPFTNMVIEAQRTQMDSDAPISDRVFATMKGSVASILSLQEHTAQSAVEMLEAPLLSFRASADHVRRAQALASVGSDAAVTNELLLAGEEYYQGIAEGAMVLAGGGGGGGRALTSLKVPLEAGKLAFIGTRLKQIHWALDDLIAWKMRTTAVLETTGGTIVGGGTRDLARKQILALKQAEVAAKLPGAHAEITTLSAAEARGWVPQAIEVSRPICPTCAAEIVRRGGVLTSKTTAVFP